MKLSNFSKKTLGVLIPLSQVSLFANLIILVSVVLNLKWVRAHAAGGQYSKFPVGIRVVYFGMTLGMIFLIGLLWNHRQKPLNRVGIRLTKILSVAFMLSTLTQLISRSTAERWNAIPAIILAITFFLLSRRD